MLSTWQFHEERAIRLADERFHYIHDSIRSRGWGTLANPLAKFDPEIVREFYANAGKEKRERKQGFKSFVRGVEIDYSPESLAQVLGVEVWGDNPLDYYHDRMRGKRRPVFEIPELEQSLCLPGREATLNRAGTKKTIFLRKSLTQ